MRSVILLISLIVLLDMVDTVRLRGCIEMFYLTAQTWVEKSFVQVFENRTFKSKNPFLTFNEKGNVPTGENVT